MDSNTYWLMIFVSYICGGGSFYLFIRTVDQQSWRQLSSRELRRPQLIVESICLLLCGTFAYAMWSPWLPLDFHALSVGVTLLLAFGGHMVGVAVIQYRLQNRAHSSGRRNQA